MGVVGQLELCVVCSLPLSGHSIERKKNCKQVTCYYLLHPTPVLGNRYLFVTHSHIYIYILLGGAAARRAPCAAGSGAGAVPFAPKAPERHRSFFYPVSRIYGRFTAAVHRKLLFLSPKSCGFPAGNWHVFVLLLLPLQQVMKHCLCFGRAGVSSAEVARLTGFATLAAGSKKRSGAR